MENADISDVSTEIFAVGSQFPQCIRRCVIQGIIQKLLVAVDDRILRKPGKFTDEET